VSAGPLLVTGASGFLGRHLLDAIEREMPAAHVVVLTRDRRAWEAAGWRPAVAELEVVEGRMEDVAAWREAPVLRGLAGIFHLAATVRHRRSREFEQERADIDGAAALVRLAARTGARMVYVSTSGTVGCSTDPGAAPDERAPFCEQAVADWPYYRGKIEAERVTRALADELGVSLVILRPPVLLGPGDHRGRSTRHVQRFLRGRLPFVVRGGMHYVDVRDVASAMVAAMRHPAPQPVYNLPGHASTIAEFFGAIAAVAGRRPPRMELPVRVAWWLATLLKPLHVLPEPTAVEMASRYWGLTSLHAERDLGHRPRPERETLADTVAALRAEVRRPVRPAPTTSA
jgi:nucleoside-diphosphate-sugar epimerase